CDLADDLGPAARRQKTERTLRSLSLLLVFAERVRQETDRGCPSVSEEPPFGDAPRFSHPQKDVCHDPRDLRRCRCPKRKSNVCWFRFRESHARTDSSNAETRELNL